jgi:tellurite resistance-related uncharacterized protein
MNVDARKATMTSGSGSGSGLPECLTPYKRTPVFDQNSLPAGLRRRHSTKAGVWGLIRVLEGRLLYRILEPASESILDPDNPGVVQPAQLHEVAPLGAVRFFVEFYERTATGEQG